MYGSADSQNQNQVPNQTSPNGEAQTQTLDAREAQNALGQMTNIPIDDTPEEKEEEEKKKEEWRFTIDLSCLKKCWDLSHRYRRYTVVLGGIFVYLPIGVPWYFGNLATYLASYFRRELHVTDEIVDPQWIFSAFFVAFSLAIVLSGYLANYLGTRLTILVAMVIHSGATFLSYFAIQDSMPALIVTFGAVGGLGAGLAYGPPMPVVSKWLPRRVGLASGVLLMGFGGGAVFYNELVTFYINPSNIKPDVTTQRTSYFSQPEVLDKVPRIFLVLGSLTLCLQLIGLLLIRDPQEGDEIDDVEATELKPIVKEQISPPAEIPKDGTDPDAKSVNSVTISVQSEPPQLSPKEVLTNKDFYILWTALGLNHYCYIIKNNYYKEFGALGIDDDHLLTSIGTVSTVAVAISRLFWGYLADVMGIKLTVMVLLGSTTILAAFWTFSLMVAAGLYFAWVVVLSWTLAGAFIVFPLAALNTFGQQHYATNYGLISTVQIVVNLASPPLIRVLLDNFSWFGVFGSVAVANVLGVIAALFLSPM